MVFSELNNLILSFSDIIITKMIFRNNCYLSPTNYFFHMR
ncbi:hypothetical protein GEOBRER4_n1992 [Citrifermentans bremense]|uniref:Uncharacterized protein n=1 Tax=Citrifermentans bremense TaxID=60035 RepID=A0A7R7FTG3_9BACT|nr:hypothetical protein GEOBRER4_n1992 [Citrifermentans bremense]